MRWKTPILEGVNTNIFSLSVGATLLVLLILCFLPVCFAHLEHLPHYNGNGVGVGKYYVNQAIDPEYTPPQEPSKISFSIQDGNGNDVYNILTMVEIYAEKSGSGLRSTRGHNEILATFQFIIHSQILEITRLFSA